MRETGPKDHVSIDSEELLKLQRKLANCLKCSYESLADHPEIMSDVRVTVNDAKTAHTLTAGLMTTFGGTLHHIIDSMIPLVSEGIELKDAEMLEEACDQVIDYAESMHVETNEINKRYAQIQKKLDGQQLSIRTRNKCALKENEDLKVEKERSQNMLKEARTELQNLEIESKNMTEALKCLEEDSVKIAKNDVAKAITGTSQQPTAHTGKEKVADVATQTQNARQNLNKIQENIEKKRIEIIKSEAKLKKLGGPVALGDAESIREAQQVTEQVHQQFTTIFCFWNTMASEIKHLKEHVCSDEDRLNDTQNVKNIKDMFDVYDKKCRSLGQRCLAYRETSGNEIKAAYAFLFSSSFGDMSHDYPQNTQGAILSGN